MSSKLPETDRMTMAQPTFLPQDMSVNTIMYPGFYIPYPFVHLGAQGIDDISPHDSDESGSPTLDGVPLYSSSLSALSAPLSHYDFMPHQGQFELQPKDVNTVSAAPKTGRVKSSAISSTVTHNATSFSGTTTNTAPLAASALHKAKSSAVPQSALSTTSHGITKKTAKRRNSAKFKECANCRTTETPMWRKGPNGTLCNKCGLYHLRHSKNRPLSSKVKETSSSSNLFSKSAPDVLYEIPSQILREVTEPVVEPSTPSSSVQSNYSMDEDHSNSSSLQDHQLFADTKHINFGNLESVIGSYPCQHSFSRGDELLEPAAASSAHDVLSMFMEDSFSACDVGYGFIGGDMDGLEPFADDVILGNDVKTRMDFDNRPETPDFFVANDRF
ncbi:nitrogen regulatory protein GLN3 [Acrasis kona]|uniref:Nitrogen regulatory protein GLN3 n=1 Tax=Acrasis kona TaxID=1008807 RepID=A0AAW2ZGS2_9EUKA